MGVDIQQEKDHIVSRKLALVIRPSNSMKKILLHRWKLSFKAMFLEKLLQRF